MHFEWSSRRDGFFSPQISKSYPNHLQRWWDSETNYEKSISHGKPYTISFSHILYTSEHVNDAEYIAQC